MVTFSVAGGMRLYCRCATAVCRPTLAASRRRPQSRTTTNAVHSHGTVLFAGRLSDAMDTLPNEDTQDSSFEDNSLPCWQVAQKWRDMISSSISRHQTSCSAAFYSKQLVVVSF